MTREHGIYSLGGSVIKKRHDVIADVDNLYKSRESGREIRQSLRRAVTNQAHLGLLLRT